MFARIAVWEPMPEDDRRWVIDAAKSIAGVRDAYHLVDPATGNGMSIASFNHEVDVSEGKSRHRGQGRRDRLARCASPPAEVRDDLQGDPQRFIDRSTVSAHMLVR